MPQLTDTLGTLLPEYGPWLLFALAVLETCFVTGLVVPSGLATSVGTALALEGEMELVPVLLAAAAGGWVGDSIGFWVGYLTGERAPQGRGRLARAVARRRADVAWFFGRHPFFSVTVARLVSFVRTLMPMAAGSSGLSYRRFLPYQALGLVGWLGIYVAIGVAGNEGWEALSRVVGAGGAAAFAGGAVLLWFLFRRRLRTRRRGAAGAAAPGAEADATPAAPEDPC